jgi:S-ribosylhomocysteine lyase LuxS involved in autoinducer biosynthesis
MTVTDIVPATNGLTLVNYDDIDLEEAQTWADSLTKSISALSKANRQIKESLQ